MAKKSSARLPRRPFLDRDIQQIRAQLEKFKPFLSRRPSSLSLEDFDEGAESVIQEIFGEASEEAESYEYAKTGEAANLPEEAQESGTQDVGRGSLHQRKQVLDECIATLEELRGARKSQPATPLASVTIEEYMCSDVRSVDRNAPIKEAGRLLQKFKVGSLMVDDGRRYVGIITDTDLSRKAVAKGLDPNKTTVKECMSKPVITIEDSEPLTEAVELMKKKGVRHLAITSDGTIMGVLSVSDLLRAYGELGGRGVKRSGG